MLEQLKKDRLSLDILKYMVLLGDKAIIQESLNSVEQQIQFIAKDEELIRLSPSGEMLNGYAFLPPDEKICPTDKIKGLIKYKAI